MTFSTMAQVQGRWFHLLHRPGNRAVAVRFLHGLGDYSAVWEPAFAHPALSGLELFAVDMPGFGRTLPVEGEALGVEALATQVASVVRETVGTQRIVLVGHSIGGVIATLLAEQEPPWLAGVVNVEGNLTEGDCFISRPAVSAPDFDQWFEEFSDRIYREGGNKQAMRNFAVGLRLTHRPTYLAACQSLVRVSEHDAIGQRYARLAIPRVCYYGTIDFTEASQQLLAQQSLPSVTFEGVGHWLITEAAEDFYRHLADWLTYVEEKEVAR